LLLGLLCETEVFDGAPSLGILLHDGELFGLINRSAFAINTRGQILTEDGEHQIRTLLTPHRD
jgi:hypothetical protein